MVRRSRAESLGRLAILACLWAGGANGQASTVTPQPFSAFLREVVVARSSDWIGRPGSAITDAESFRAMRRHILSLYRDVRVERSLSVDGQVFDCVRKVVRRPVGGHAAPARRPATGAAASECPPGAVAMRRVTLDEMARMGSPRAFFGKSPGGGDADHFRKP